jgi:hypothetical protein
MANVAHKVQVIVDGKLIAERRTDRPYTRAVVAERYLRPAWSVQGATGPVPMAEPKLQVYGFTRNDLTARSMLRAAQQNTLYRNARVVETIIVPIVPRKKKEAQ